MRGKRLTLGYREVRAQEASMLLAKGQTARGHEFHWSALDREPAQPDAAYEIIKQDAENNYEGYQARSLVASYVHLHFASNPSIARNFVANCAAWSCEQLSYEQRGCGL
jgi:cobyrinic acid a,c-diamide synthase